MRDELIERAWARLAQDGFRRVAASDDELRVATDGAHELIMRSFRRGGQVVLVLLAPIAAEADLSPRRMLARVAELGAGGIALVEGLYVLRMTIPEAQLAIAPLAEIARYVARGAIELRAELAVPKRPAAPFSHYAD